MRMLYYGVFDGRRWRSEYPIKEAFETLGYQLWLSNFRSRLPWRISADWKKNKARTDLVFIQNGIPFPVDMMQQFDCPVAYLASEFSLQSQIHLLQSKRPPDFVLAHSEQVFEWCQHHQIPTRRIHHAYNPHFYKRLEIPYLYDLCFIGGMTPRRLALLEALQKHFKVKVATSWKPAEVNQIYNQSRLVLHIHAQEETYLPTRFFEVLPTQGCFLTEDLGQNEVPELKPGYVSWKDLKDLLEKTELLLKNPEQRQALVAQANALAPEHTWLARIREYDQIFKSLKGLASQ
ncbi:hypothetical protein COW36_22960 [bacterium (Candidatus Blackallbacteria) CG17_big_fil_post_rev_8_21_14_2_50_48_46]|uniref:Spore protein YkvP/CgeB glycosyl transferase-like domain-containing protein n=1 Tax=bacterium (Candidatus Blackallbacteria) CG17_big_fil_post_rev_8_21_14_2_50_48_46 TaxID=2014261 RepID=A0A2M7FXT3_9BACT|nr:MAG: hypothetical protein COW64_16030 [bacterium (Candidatus Blackallbacteria) CG18_big_fil_WC_8_21_14_2_50_49_26]PIW14111.1 MAG: hypothetical protein COW36_22960 [bacterium (Candidatus Blackallbacteria) CG17_big_fil_post_rev_8_21_14_2_50_48_46]PIW45841.1 MAG: hypothetical protein COW20_18625 [bacterium (Candidatus Blackallbacteria) CG13_big_fil_rev_8_21_14_2_50_49_14]